jgi:hypothetical protein
VHRNSHYTSEHHGVIHQPEADRRWSQGESPEPGLAAEELPIECSWLSFRPEVTPSSPGLQGNMFIIDAHEAPQNPTILLREYDSMCLHLWRIVGNKIPCPSIGVLANLKRGTTHFWEADCSFHVSWSGVPNSQVKKEHWDVSQNWTFVSKLMMRPYQI